MAMKGEENMPKKISDTEQKNAPIGIERNEYVLNLINGWIVSADNKISVAFAIFSALFAMTNYFSIKDLDIISGLSVTAFWTLIGFLFISLLLFMTSLVFFFLCLKPSLDSNARRKQYSIFYDEVATFDKAKDYVKACEKATIAEYNEELCSEIYYNSKICSSKMQKFIIGLVFSLISIILSVLILISVVIIKHFLLDVNIVDTTKSIENSASIFFNRFC